MQINWLVSIWWGSLVINGLTEWLIFTQLTFTCSNSTIETLEKRCEICSKLRIKTLDWRHWRHSGVFIVDFEHISYLFSSVSICCCPCGRRSEETLYCTKKWRFPSRFSSVNVSKSAGICWLGHIYWRNLNGKLHFLCSVTKCWKIFITHFDSNNNSSIVFNRSFYSLLITVCLQNIHASCGCLKKKLTNWTTC